MGDLARATIEWRGSQGSRYIDPYTGKWISARILREEPLILSKPIIARDSPRPMG